MRYALIGEKLSHSYSKIIHNLCGLDYSLVQLQREQLKDFVSSRSFDGFNVTIPYKKDIIEYLDCLTDTAKSIGAVNTVYEKDGKLTGDNTDFYGMQFMFENANISVKDKTVLILGTGGASNTALAYAKAFNAKAVYRVSRSGPINYENAYEIPAEIIINTTPVGTYPNNGESPIDVKKIPTLQAVVDCVYNPLYTKLVLDAKAQNLKTANGLSMLVAQALKAQEVWGVKIADKLSVNEVYQKLLKDTRNIVLVGMPSSGKSTLGKLLANECGRQFVDTDTLIFEKTGKSAKDIILEKGESVFRDIESEVCLEIGKRNRLVIATGGGSVLREENRYALKQNSVCVLINRALDKLSSEDRPLSASQGLAELYERRKEIYRNFADLVIDNNADIDTALRKLKELL